MRHSLALAALCMNGLAYAEEMPVSLDLAEGHVKVKPADARFSQGEDGSLIATFENSGLKTFRRIVVECDLEKPLEASAVILRIDPGNAERFFLLAEDESGRHGEAVITSQGEGVEEYVIAMDALKSKDGGFPAGSLTRLVIFVPMAVQEGEQTVRIESLKGNR